MDDIKKKLLAAGGFRKEVEAVSSGRCPFCKLPVDQSKFKDALSRKEFAISGICAKCQDDFFK